MISIKKYSYLHEKYLFLFEERFMTWFLFSYLKLINFSCSISIKEFIYNPFLIGKFLILNFIKYPILPVSLFWSSNNKQRVYFNFDDKIWFSSFVNGVYIGPINGLFKSLGSYSIIIYSSVFFLIISIILIDFSSFISSSIGNEFKYRIKTLFPFLFSAKYTSKFFIINKFDIFYISSILNSLIIIFI
jgi:hypothetical protein